MKKLFKVLALLILGFLLFKKEEVIKLATNLPRGIRNNNPMNLRDTSTVWNGETDQNLDSSFEEFESPEFGIRAGAKVLLIYERKYGLDTVEKILNRFAPSSENNTESYINHVSKAIGFAPNESFNVRDNLTPLIKAIIKHENGFNPYADDTIERGVSMALV